MDNHSDGAITERKNIISNSLNIDSIKVTNAIQDEIIGRVAKKVWENELVAKFNTSFTSKDAMIKASYLMGSNPDIREDDQFLNKAKPMNDIDEPDNEADIVSYKTEIFSYIFYYRCDLIWTYSLLINCKRKK